LDGAAATAASKSIAVGLRAERGKRKLDRSVKLKEDFMIFMT
jgi:hypothetical protein